MTGTVPCFNRAGPGRELTSRHQGSAQVNLLLRTGGDARLLTSRSGHV